MVWSTILYPPANGYCHLHLCRLNSSYPDPGSRVLYFPLFIFPEGLVFPEELVFPEGDLPNPQLSDGGIYPHKHPISHTGVFKKKPFWLAVVSKCSSVATPPYIYTHSVCVEGGDFTNSFVYIYKKRERVEKQKLFSEDTYIPDIIIFLCVFFPSFLI